MEFDVTHGDDKGSHSVVKDTHTLWAEILDSTSFTRMIERSTSWTTYSLLMSTQHVNQTPQNWDSSINKT